MFQELQGQELAINDHTRFYALHNQLTNQPINDLTKAIP
jgi:hypothetical protein